MHGAHSPVAESERAQILDVVRGFCLLGILVSHIPDFSGYGFLPPDERSLRDIWGWDARVREFAELLVRGKFYSLFSFLFGIGFAIQLESAERQGANFRRRFARRMLILLAIGILHSLVWYGDILLYYAVLGLLLMPTAGWDARRTLRAAIAAFSLRAAWGLVVLASGSFLATLVPPSLIDDSGESLDLLQLVRTFADGSLAQSFVANLEFLRIKALQMVYDGKIISVFAMFLLGVSVGKQGLFRNLEAHRLLLRRVFLVSAPLGLVGNAILVPLHAATSPFPPTLLRAAENLIFSIAVPALTLAYATGLSLLWLHPPARAGLRWLAPPGRMALTTYLSATAICVAVFYGVGLGWMWSLGQTQCLLFAFALFGVQALASRLWLERFRFGPVEWAWRCATYGARLPLRR